MAQEFELAGKVTLDASQLDAAMNSVNENLQEAIEKQKKLVEQFGEMSPEVKAANKEIDKMQQNLQELASKKENLNFVPLKKQLKDATIELQTMSERFGPMSAEAAKAARKVAELKDAIGDAKDLADAFSPDAKFNAFAGSLSGVVGGFSAVQGAMAVFGGESKELEKTLAKVQGAMALSQGLNSVIAAKDQFKNLGSVIKNTTAFQSMYSAATKIASRVTAMFGVAVEGTSVAFKVLRGAIISTGIGALVVVLGLLVDKIMEWTDSTKDQEAAEKALGDAMERNQKLMEDEISQIDYVEKARIQRAKIAGKTEAEITEIEVNAINDRIEAKKKRYEQDQKIADDASKNDKISAEKRDEINKQATKSYQEYLNSLNEADLKNLERQANAAEKERDQQKKRDDEAKQRREKNKEKQKQEAKEIEEATKASKENQLKIEQEIDLLRIKDEGERNKKKLAQELENAKASVNQSKATAEQKAKEIAALEKKYAIDLEALNESIRKEKLQKEIEFNNKRTQLINENILGSIKDEYTKQKEAVKLNYEQQYNDIEENETYNATQKLELKKQLAIREQQELAVIDNQKAVADFEKEKLVYDKLIADNTIRIDIKKQALDTEQRLIEEAYSKGTLTEEQYTAKTKELADKRIQIGELEKQAKEQQVIGIAGVLSNLSELAGKETAAGKALSVASTTISTFSAAQKAYQSAFMPVPTPASPALGAIYAGVAVAQGIANIKKILAVKVPNAGGSGGSVPSSATMPMAAPMAPLAPTAGSTMINQDQINNLATANATVRAYVVESDVSGNQDRITRINRAATII